MRRLGWFTTAAISLVGVRCVGVGNAVEVYDAGTLAEYRGCYEPTYGKFMAHSFPAPGSHDYGVP